MEHISYYLRGPHSKPKALANPVITGFPLYGIGAYLVIILDQVMTSVNILIKFIAFGLVLSILEYITGLYVGAGPHSSKGDMVDSWDYSKEPYNLHGIIDLKHFFLWGFLGLIVRLIYPQLTVIITNGLKC